MARLVIDAVGGDNGLAPNLEGAALASREFDKDDELIIVGETEKARKYIEEHKLDIKINHRFVDAVNNVTMDDSPVKAVKEKDDSSISKGLQLVRNREADGFFSAGNTGAILAFSLVKLGRIKGIMRPALGTVFPVGNNPLILDVGATPDVKPEMLYQFAIMGSEYCRYSMGIDKPSVGLLSIGSENSKGSMLSQKVFDLLNSDNRLNFYGNIEGSDFFENKVNVIVCDGFTGNVVLKFGEGMAKYFKESLKGIADTSFKAKLGLGIAYNEIRKFFNTVSYDEIGGAPLLGVDGISLVGHGKSNVKAITNALKNARRLVENNLIKHISEHIEQRSFSEEG